MSFLKITPEKKRFLFSSEWSHRDIKKTKPLFYTIYSSFFNLGVWRAIVLPQILVKPNRNMRMKTRYREVVRRIESRTKIRFDSAYQMKMFSIKINTNGSKNQFLADGQSNVEVQLITKKYVEKGSSTTLYCRHNVDLDILYKVIKFYLLSIVGNLQSSLAQYSSVLCPCKKKLLAYRKSHHTINADFH